MKLCSFRQFPRFETANFETVWDLLLGNPSSSLGVANFCYSSSAPASSSSPPASSPPPSSPPLGSNK